jgi:hypothetical protein
MNISRFHISCIQKTDNRPYFTAAGALDHLEHFKHTEQYADTIWFFLIGVCGLPMKEGRQRACAKSRPHRCCGNIRKRYLLSEYASYKEISRYNIPKTLKTKLHSDWGGTRPAMVKGLQVITTDIWAFVTSWPWGLFNRVEKVCVISVARRWQLAVRQSVIQITSQPIAF